MRNRVRSIAKTLAPVPFLMGVAMFVAAFWQTDADFALGKVATIEAMLVDSGQPRPSRGRPRYFPTYRLSDGRLLTLTRATVASDLPPPNHPIALQCSTVNPGNCKLSADSSEEWVFYGLALLWSLFSVVLAVLVWGPLCSKALRRP